jgi:hypothetical protein
LKITLCRSGKRRCLYLHRVICSAFHGLPPARDYHCGHLDGEPGNNKPENLAWVSASENAKHNYALGRQKRGQAHPMAKLTDAEVEELRVLHSCGASTRELARWYRSKQPTVHHIISGKHRLWPA